MGAYGGLFCSAWDEDIGGIFGGHLRCVLNIGFGVAGWQFSQQPLVLGRRRPGSTRAQTVADPASKPHQVALK